MSEKANGNIRLTAQWISSTVLIALLAYLITAVVRFDRITVKVDAHELRITTLEDYIMDEQKKQPMRDYILSEIAKRQGIEVPRGLK